MEFYVYIFKSVGTSMVCIEIFEKFHFVTSSTCLFQLNRVYEADALAF